MFAFGLEVVVHEVVGHAVVCSATGGKVVLISSTAMQTASASRVVPAAGPVANILLGVVVLVVLLRVYGRGTGAARLTVGALFLWFFCFANLFLASGYIFYSGWINFGDFAAVIDGMRPAWLYRIALVVVGGFGYRYCIRLAASSLAAIGPVPISDARRIVYAGCAAGGGLFLLASVFNPIGPSLILYDGLSGAIGLTLGFFLALTDLRQSAALVSTDSPIVEATGAAFETSGSIPFSMPLTISSAIFVVGFIAFMGRGIRIR
ncbi:MAG TPA: hypothetical protein VGG58_09115 [Candidatus Acidoferrum sp.]